MKQKDFLALIVRVLVTNTESEDTDLILLRATLSLLLATLASTEAMNKSEMLSSYKVILSNINVTLSLQCSQSLAEFAETLTKLNTDDLKNEEGNEIVLAKWRDLINILSAKRVSLETLANICSDNDYEDEDMDMDAVSNCSEKVSEDGEDLLDSVTLDPEIESEIVRLRLAEQVLNHLDSPNDIIKEAFSKVLQGREIMALLVSLQKDCLVCINNLAQCLPKEHLSGSLTLSSHLFELVKTEAANSKAQLLPEAVSVIRALVVNNLLVITDSELPLFLGFASKSTNDDLLRVNSTKILGSHASTSFNLAEIESIVLLLLQIVESADSGAKLDLKAEALDNIMDILSEDKKTDAIILKANITGRLEAISADFRAEVKATRFKEKCKNPVADTVLLNLKRFIKYKKATVRR